MRSVDWKVPSQATAYGTTPSLAKAGSAALRSESLRPHRTVMRKGHEESALHLNLFARRVSFLGLILAELWEEPIRHELQHACVSTVESWQPGKHPHLSKPPRGAFVGRGWHRHTLAVIRRPQQSIVGNVNFFMSVPVLPDGSAGIAGDVSPPGSLVELCAERDVLAVLTNCRQMHNPCNGYNPTPIHATIYRPPPSDGG